MNTRTIEQVSETTDQILIPTAALDVDGKSILELRIKAFVNLSYRRAIANDHYDIEAQVEHWRKFNRGSYGDLKVIDYLRRSGLVEANPVVRSTFAGRSWQEHIRFATDSELNFLELARSIAGGKFTEIMQISVLTENTNLYQKKLILGGSNSVKVSDMESIFSNLPKDQSQLDTIHIVHNHPDHYRDALVPKEGIGEKNLALIMEGGISSSDVEYANLLTEKYVSPSVKVYMHAIGERGLTYTYKALTSVNT